MKISNRAILCGGAYNPGHRSVRRPSVQSPAAALANLERSSHRQRSDIDYEACGMDVLFALGHGAVRGAASCATILAFRFPSLRNQ
jgi:hypothetical protein